MFFYFRNKNKTVKELRKNMSLTVKELAFQLKCESIDLLKVDHLELKEIPKDLREKLIPIFRGDHYDNIPW
ncbi:MAG: transcriptional regulator [Marinisporobacter sp.]|jgi:hypothetical protein|nr:transcriptional regulator [Marinisporobacter sp.]